MAGRTALARCPRRSSGPRPRHAAPGDQAALGHAAHARGLYRDAAQLHKNAAAAGNTGAALYLSHAPADLRTDLRPAHWAAAHIPFDRPGAVGVLLGRLRKAGADEQAAALVAREPAAHAPLDDPAAWPTCWTACGRRARTSRPPRWWPVTPPPTPPSTTRTAWPTCWTACGQAGADEQAAALVARDPAAHAPLDDPYRVAKLLDSLRQAGADEQAAALTGRLRAAGLFGLFLEQKGLADQFRFGREADGTPAPPWGWEDLDLWLVPRPRRQAYRRNAEQGAHVGTCQADHAVPRIPRPGPRALGPIRPSAPKPKR